MHTYTRARAALQYYVPFTVLNVVTLLLTLLQYADWVCRQPPPKAGSVVLHLDVATGRRKIVRL